MKLTHYRDYTASVDELRTSAPARLRSRLVRWVIGAHLGLALLLILPPLLIGGMIAWVTHIVKGPNEVLGVATAVLCILSIVHYGSLLSLFRNRLVVPGGLDLEEKDAPELFMELHELVRKCQAPRFDAVLLSADLNASVWAGPRPGVNGTRRYLVLGAPLLSAFPAQEMRAVLAHEIFHRNCSDWLITGGERVIRWLGAALPFTAPFAKATGPYDALLSWFAPRFRGLWQVYGWSMEIRADALGAELGGREAMAAALCRLAVLETHFDEWLQCEMRRSYHLDHPPADLLARWASYLERLSPEESEKALRLSLDASTRFNHTHPTLRDRLAALQVSPATVSYQAKGALHAWLGGGETEMGRKFQIWWAAAISGFWSQMRDAKKEAAAIWQKSLKPDSEHGAASTEHLFQAAWATLELDGPLAAEPLMRKVIESDPCHPQALSWLIPFDLKANNPTASEHIANHPNPDIRSQLWQMAAETMARLGDASGERYALQQADDALVEATAFQSGRQLIRPGDQLYSHTLTPEQAACLAERAAVHPVITRVAVVRKRPGSKGPAVHIFAVEHLKADLATIQGALRHIFESLQALKVAGDWHLQAVRQNAWHEDSLLFDLPGCTLYSHDHASR